MVCKLGTKRDIQAYKNGIPISIVITFVNTHYIKTVTDIVNNAVVKQKQMHKPSSPVTTAKFRATRQHLCLDRVYVSKAMEQEMIKWVCSPYVTQKKEKGKGEARQREMFH